MKKVSGKIQNIIRFLQDNDTYLQVFLVPCIMLVGDIMMKAVTEVGLTDVGADMAFLSVSTFLALIMEDQREKAENVKIIMTFLAVSVIPWVFSLLLVSNLNDRQVSILNLHFNLLTIFIPLSWLVGLSSLFIFGITAHELSKIEQNE